MGNYHDNFIIGHVNTDSNGDVVSQPINNEQITVLLNGYAFLSQRPHKPARVTINGLIEVDGGSILAENEFWVDYSDCVVHFHTSKVGQEFLVDYYGIGQEFINAKRVATEITENGDVAQTLQDDVDEFKADGLEALETFDTNSSNAILEFNNDGIDAISTFNTNGQNKINQIQQQTDTFLDTQETRVDGKIIEVNNKITEVNTNMDNINTEFEQIKDDYDNATHVQMIKMEEGLFTATSDNTNSFILPTGFYNPLIDILYLEYGGLPLKTPKNYILLGQEVDLQFYINTGEEIYYKVLKGVKDAPPIGSDGSGLMNESVGQSKLTLDVQDKLNFVGDLESYGLAVLKENETIFTATVNNTTTFTLPVDFYNPITDIPELRYKGEFLERDKNYSISGYTVTLGWGINTGEIINIRILKGSRRDIPMGSDGADIMNKSIPLVKMTQDVQDKISFIDDSKSKIDNLPSNTNSSLNTINNNINTINSNIGNKSSLTTTDKTSLVNSINELNSQKTKTLRNSTIINNIKINEAVSGSGNAQYQLYNGVNYDTIHFETGEENLVNILQSLSGTGYRKLAGGLILQWGTSGATFGYSNVGTIDVNFPTTFLNACYGVVTNIKWIDGFDSSSASSSIQPNYTTTGFSVSARYFESGCGGQYFQVFWIALGK